MSRVVIIGGGITGLAAAWELQQQGIAYTLLEATDRLGGKIITERAGGFIVEGGADSFLTQKPWAWQLCREIGLAERLIGTNDAQRTVYVLRHGRLHPMPRGMRLIVPLGPDGLMESALLSEQGKRRMLAETEVPPRQEDGDESLASFVRRRFGEEALEVFGDSVLAGIHVGDPATLSVQATFPAYPALERTHGSLIRGLNNTPSAPPIPGAPETTFVSLRDGVSEMVERLGDRLSGAIQTNQTVASIGTEGTVRLDSGASIAADAVILTVPARTAHHLLREAAPDLSGALATIRSVSSGTISLGYRAADVAHPLDGFGFVVPRSERTRLLACTWSSTKLPYRAPDGCVLLRVFVGGHGREADVALSDDELVALARRELRRIMGIEAPPVISRVFRWREANPQYEVGHLERVARIAALCPPWLFLAGSSYGGVGIPDCVRQGREAARRAADTVA